MIRPSEVDVSKKFMDSAFQNSERETVARNITLLSQAVAFSRDDDRWPPFTVEDYDTFREATSSETVTSREKKVLTALANSGHISIRECGTLVVTGKFLGVVAQFATPESVEQVIAK